MLCGQAMMAAADTAMVLALMQHFGQFRPRTTVQLSSSFLLPAQDARCMRVLRAGKALIPGEIEIARPRRQERAPRQHHLRVAAAGPGRAGPASGVRR